MRWVASFVVVFLVGSEAAADKQPSSLAPRAYNPLPVGSVTPKGWLLKQLELQAEGLGGHLALFWNDVMNSSWIGGNGDGGLHERAPYWLNGMVPLAFLLKNAGMDQLSPVTGIYKAPRGVKGQNGEAPICEAGIDMVGHDISSFEVDSMQQCHDNCTKNPSCLGFVVNTCMEKQKMTCWLKSSAAATAKASCRCYGKVVPKPQPVDVMAQVEKYVDHILSHLNPDGWLGPEVNKKDGSTYWGPSNAMQALYQYAEGSNDKDKFTKAKDAVLNHLLEQKRRMASVPLTSWAAARWIDMAMTAEWVIDNDETSDHKEDLMELIAMLKQQGSDWEQWFEHFTGNAGSHNVNNAQGLKSAAVYARYNSSATYEGHSMKELSQRRMAHMDQHYGLPTGMFNGDELLPDPANRNPSRGIELCGVVEAMFSYDVMFSVHGDPSFAERAERIAYNALPATWASPKGGDMWAHQYLQAVNQINAVQVNPHVWTHDGDFSETYGLEPNYGCCTANFHQGWPKLANMLMYSTSDGGAAVSIYAPASASLPGGVTVDVDTTYPFGDSATVTVTAPKTISVHLRIPSWATAATVNGSPAANGTMWKGEAKQGSTTFVVKFNPSARLEEWDGGAVSVHRGALMYSLPITGQYITYAHHYGRPDEMSDYFVLPTTEWQYALEADPQNLSSSFVFAAPGYVDGAAPFNHTNWPTFLNAGLRHISWLTTLNSASAPPTSPACSKSKWCGPVEHHVLVPHGGTDLRIGEFPLASFPGIAVQKDDGMENVFV